MKEPVDAAGVMAELEGQPETVRKVFIYAICQTMVEAGMLEFKGASTVDGMGTILMYRNPDTEQIFEITKPDLPPQEEEMMREHIRQLLEKQA